MQIADGNSEIAEKRVGRALTCLRFRSSSIVTMFKPLPYRRFLVAQVLALALLPVACSTGAGFSPAGAQAPPDSEKVTVPDDISSLDSDEVERRLGRLLNGDVAGGQAAPDVEPTRVPDEPTLEEILELLNATMPVPASGDIVISISPASLKGLANPVLRIKSAASHGSATVMSPNRILYVPDGSGDGSDAFEYELLDGDTSVISQVMEIRR